MKSNKTEILGFEDSWKENRHVCDSTKNLAKVMYLDGQKSKQSEIEDLQKRVKELELINFDSELHFDAAKEHIDHLQKRIDEVVHILTYTNHASTTLCNELREILKGNTNEH